MRAPFSCSSHNYGMTLDWGSQSINDHQPLPPPWASYFNFWPSSCWVSMPDEPTETDLRMTRTPASSVAAPSTSRITTAIIITIISQTRPICRTSSPGSGSPTLFWFWRMIKMLNWVRNDMQDYLSRKLNRSTPPSANLLILVAEHTISLLSSSTFSTSHFRGVRSVWFLRGSFIAAINAYVEHRVHFVYCVRLPAGALSRHRDISLSPCEGPLRDIATRTRRETRAVCNLICNAA